MMAMIESQIVPPYALPGHSFITEPDLLFDGSDSSHVDPHPLHGLNRFGPFSSSLLGAVNDPIRIAVVGPHEAAQRVHSLLAELEQWHTPSERHAYLAQFNGFQATFGVSLAQLNDPQILLAKSLDKELQAAERPHRILADHLARAINAFHTRRADFDVLMIFVPERWSACYGIISGEDFDLHTFVKSHTASLGIPTQVIREDRVLTYRDRCSVAWRLSIALYCKAGGTPWKLANTEADAMYVGLGYAVKFDSDGRPVFLTTCSQVFDNDGTGLEFLAYETGDMRIDGDNQYLSRADMYRVMSRSLDLFQHRHAGSPPRAVVVHKAHPFKAEEQQGCFDAFRCIDRVELVQVQHDAHWRGAHLDPPSNARQKNKAGYACRRGSYLMLSGSEALLWTQGNVPQRRGQDFFKENKGTPKPLLLRRFAGQGVFSETCRLILGLTKMDWNNDALYDRLPVTLSFASTLAQTLKRMPTLTSKPYPFRLFM
jgi:hypothetical protein